MPLKGNFVFDSIIHDGACVIYIYMVSVIGIRLRNQANIPFSRSATHINITTTLKLKRNLD